MNLRLAKVRVRGSLNNHHFPWFIRTLRKITLGFFVLFFLFFSIASCSLIDISGDVEPYSDFNFIQEGGYYLCQPWRYTRAVNRFRNYPLLVYLHGSGGAGEPRGLAHFGYGQGEVAVNFKRNHPCFVYAAQTGGVWDYSLLISQIEDIRLRYRIDAERIYLAGYSMGGSGSYALARAYHDYNGTVFAGIIRLAGQSQVELPDEIIEKSSIWLHIGLLDSEVRVETTRDAFDFLKLPGLTEGGEAVRIPDHPGWTQSLYDDGFARFRMTEYAVDGHGISNFPFSDPRLVEWLFERRLRKY